MSDAGKKKITALTAITAACAVFFSAVFWQGLAIRTYTVHTSKLKSPVRIALITDLHGSLYGSSQKDLIKAVKKQKPDLVLLSGDIFDEYTEDDNAERLLTALSAFYPCFYITGNHENWRSDTAEIKEWVRSCGITVLEGTGVTVTVNNQKLQIFGVDDPEAFSGSSYSENTVGSGWYRQLETCQKEIEDGTFCILMSHRPELVAAYENSGFDLVLSGHAHGGQWRIPGIVNGIYSPNQGFFPQFAGGLYELENTDLIVSRGLCKNEVPRVFNPPELVIVNMKPICR
ncbi:MAG TPA: metallophosphoesterase [Oscillospiraceae bacterium]|nr:metallophosphoesterase [Oscillospiraceae bacterium]HPF55278.1 metallophosphoesterase [Clostridiales bacterium]HPK34682.1 metallophosphoesterase [Oscillospiraceae bacterium]HPR74554.1 metallophosphoesterase [Oscillospiraceae bacterium]